MAEDDKNIQPGKRLLDENLDFVSAKEDKPEPQLLTSMVVQNGGNFIDDPALDESTSINFDLKPERPGWFETFGGTFGSEAHVVRGIEQLTDHIAAENPSPQDPDNDWSALDNESYYLATKEEDWPRLMEATNGADQLKTFNSIKARDDQDAYLRSGPGSAHLLGSLSAAIFGSPSTLIPFAATIKYAKLSKTFLNSMARITPGMYTSATMYNLEEQLLDGQVKGKELIEKSFVDTVFGMTLVGTGLGLGAGFRSNRLYNAKKYHFDIADDLEIVQTANEKGQLVGGLTARATAGSSVGAEKVKLVQDSLNFELNRTGLFAFSTFSKVISKTSPQVEGRISPFRSVVTWTGKMFPSSFDLKGSEKGIAQEITATELKNELRTKNELTAQTLRGFWLNSMGITSENQLKQGFDVLKQKWSKEGLVTEPQFYSKVIDVLLNSFGTDAEKLAAKAGNKHIDGAAELVRSRFEENIKRYAEAHDLDATKFTPKNASTYLMHILDKDQALQREEQFIQTGVGALKDQDRIIDTLNQPVLDAKDNLDRIQALKSITPKGTDEFKRISAQAKEASSAHKRAVDSKTRELRDNPKHRILLQDGLPLSSSEATELNALLKPVKDIDKNIDKLNSAFKRKTKKSLTIESLSKRASELNEPSIQKKLKAIEKNQAQGRILQKDQTNLVKMNKQLHEIELNALEDSKEQLLDGLKERARNKEIPREFFDSKEEGRLIEFRDPENEIPELRKSFEGNTSAMENSMSAYREKILGISAEQINDSILHNLNPRNVENALKSRTIMIDQKVWHEAGFLSVDLPKMLSLNTMTLGKKSILKELYPEHDFSEGVETIFKGLQEQHIERTRFNENIKGLKSRIEEVKKLKGKDRQEIELNKKNLESLGSELKDQLKLQKKGQKGLIKELQSAKRYLKKTYDIFMGRNDENSSSRTWSNSARNFTAAAKLSATPISQLADLTAFTLKNGMWPVISKGIIPILKTLGAKTKGKLSKDIKSQMDALGLALEHATGSHRDFLHNRDLENSPPMGDIINGAFESTATRLERKTKWLAHAASNLYGITYVDNFYQKVLSTMSQSEVMRMMFDFKSGTLSPRNLKKLLRLGITPAEDAERMIQQFKTHGGYKNLGAFQTKWHEWSDIDMVNKMKLAIKRTVSESLLIKGPIDTPGLAEGPVWDLILQFKGWAFSAFNRYTLPLLQRPHMEDLLPMGLMLGMGAMISPIRRFSRGEDFDFTTEGWALDAIDNSGLISMPFNVLQVINSATGGAIFNIGDKYIHQQSLGSLAGPFGGILNDLWKTVGLVKKKQIVLGDAKRISRMMPLVHPWYFQGVINDYLEGLGLPKRRGGGHGSVWGK